MSNNSLISQIRINVVEKDSLRAIASVKVADAFYLTGLRVIEGKNGLFVAMPTRKDKAGEYQDIFFPGSKTVRDDLQAMVLEAYKNEVGKLVAA